MKRVSTIAIHNFCERNCSFCPALGYLRERHVGIEQFTIELQSARSRGVDCIRLPCSTSDFSALAPYIYLIRSFGFKLEVVVHLNVLRSEGVEWIQEIGGKSLSREEFSIVVLLPMEKASGETDLFFEIRNSNNIESYLLVSKKGDDLVERVKSLPQFVVDDLRFGFPFSRGNDSFFSNDEVYLTLRELHRECVGLNLRSLSNLYEGVDPTERKRWSKDIIFRETLSGSYFLANMDQLGRNAPLRAITRIWMLNRWFWPLRPLLFLPLALIWLIIDPKRAKVEVSGALDRSFTFVAWSVYPVLRELDRHGEAALSYLYWRLYRLLGIFKVFFGSLYWHTHHLVGNLKVILENIIWKLSYPFRKAFYFTSYQVKTRVLGSEEQ